MQKLITQKKKKILILAHVIICQPTWQADNKKSKKQDIKIQNAVPRDGKRPNLGNFHHTDLNRIVSFYSKNALSIGTKKTYGQGKSMYIKFLKYINFGCNVLPPNYEMMLLFIAYLPYYRKLSFQCIRTYIYMMYEVGRYIRAVETLQNQAKRSIGIRSYWQALNVHLLIESA